MRLALLLLMTWPGLGGILEIAPRHTRDYDESSNQGWCSIRVWVDDEVNIFVEAGRVIFETVRGRPARDTGSECSQPLPRGNALSDFQFRGIDGRGEVRLIEDPGPRNRYRAWIRIRDPKGGGEDHHFRLNWKYNQTQYENGASSPGRSRSRKSQQSRDSSGRYYDERTRSWRMKGDGVCFYPERDFGGEAFCSRLGDDRPNMARTLAANYQSVRFFGRIREVDVFEQEEYRGASARLKREERDLSRIRNNRGESLVGRIQSYKVR